MRIKAALSLCLLALVAQAAAPDTPQAGQAPPPKPEQNVRIIEQIVAKVNNEIITQGELDRARRQVEAALVQQKVPEAKAKEYLQQAERDMLRDKIDQLLLVQKAKDENITVDTEVSKQIANIQLEVGVTDPDKFQTMVREQTGMSFEDYKQQLKDDMMRQQLIRREVYSKVVIPQTEFKKYYDEHPKEFTREEAVLLREIFLSTDGKDAAAVEKKAKDLVARARKAENFATLAKDNSDSESGRSGGELPPYKRGSLRKELEDIVFGQQRGYVTDPIRMPNGFLILKVEEHYTSGLQPYEQVEQEVMERVYGPRMQPKLREYLTELRQDAFLEIRAGYTDSAAAPGKDTTWRDAAKLTPATVTKEEVASMTRRKRLFFIFPVPGTKTQNF